MNYLKRLTGLSSILILGVFLCGQGWAAEKPSDPSKQTPWDLYVTSQEAAQMKQEQGDKVLFIDVRDPVEIMFTGFTDIVDINIPYMLANRNKWNEKKSVFLMELNPNFEAEILKALEDRELTKDAPIILMCRSGGTRGAPSAKVLFGKNYKNVYVVTDGFEGGALKKGERKGWRLKNGWKNAKLPWSYKLDQQKIYRAGSGN